MLDVHSIIGGAEQIHQIFESIFYTLVTLFLLLGVILEYFKLPLGDVPGFSWLVGRALIAVMLLCLYPEVSNTLAALSDSLSSQLGDLNNFKVVLTEMGKHFHLLSASWISVKDTILVAITFLTFLLLYAAVYFVEAMTLYAWVILYVFSPVLIALYVLPVTASATKALFRSLIEVSLWKIVFAAMATLLWTSAASDINQSGANISFITVIIYNLFLAASLLMTPVMIHALAGAGVSSLAQSLGSSATGTAVAAPGQVLGVVGLPKAAAGFVAKKGLDAAASAYNAKKERSNLQEDRGVPKAAKKDAYRNAHAERAQVAPMSKPIEKRKS